MKMTAAEKQERKKALIMAGPVGVWIRIGQSIGYAKAMTLLLGMTVFLLAIGSFFK